MHIAYGTAIYLFVSELFVYAFPADWYAFHKLIRNRSLEEKRSLDRIGRFKIRRLDITPWIQIIKKR